MYAANAKIVTMSLKKETAVIKICRNAQPVLISAMNAKHARMDILFH